MENVDAVETMEKELYVAAMKGNVELLEETGRGDGYFLGKTLEKNNILHIAIRHEQHEFVEACMRKFPYSHDLICEGNSKGNTPLHIAAEAGNLSIVSLIYDYLEERIKGRDDGKPWRVQNSKGNTPVHVALVHDNIKIARFLLEKDPYLAYIVNKSKEAPLHLAIKHHVNYTECESIMTRIKQPVHEGGAALTINFVPREDMRRMIDFLVEKGSSVTCWPDANGLTPLHRAASLNMPYNVELIRFILYHCPQSAEICDASGRSILHLLISRMPSYQEGKKLLSFKEIYALRNYQDQQGNTPLHGAVWNEDINMVRVLLESSTKLSIKNTEGISVASLIQEHNLLEMLRNRNMTREDCEAANTANIPFLRERMSKSGMDFLLSQDSMGRNVLHILMEIKNESRIMKDDYVDFIQQVLGIYPALVCQTDLNGDTPVHILVRNNPDTKIHFASGNQDHSTQQTSDGNTDLKNNVTSLLSVLLELCNETYKSILKIQTDSASFRGSRIGSPWLVQNAKGNTPLHEVLGTNNTKLVSKLLTNDRRSACLVNKCKETPLHVLAGRSTNMEPINTKDIELMVEANVKATLSLDQNNNTPVLRAIQACNISTATKLCTLSPDAAKFCDANGQTIWHLLVNHPSAYYLHLLLKIKTLREQLKLKDNDGNTPLHLAIQGNRFDLLEVFLDSWKSECESESSKGKDQWLVDLIKIPNKAGKTSGDLIAESPSLPPKIEKSIGNRCEMIGVRSIWGVPTTQMKTYVNTMGVIAALITTITFTAAFTIPGGLNQDKGTPILIERATFQVFMISDVLAMCLSMMVLFCLLWIMATNSRDNSVMLLDFSVTLLLASFYATVITFMTGLFATMFPVKPWIAIVTLALCSLLLVLVHKFLVIKLLLPVRKATLCFVWMLMRSACEVFGKITKCCERTPSRGAGGQDLPPANINKV